MEKNLVFNHEGIMVTSSRKVAEDFKDGRHDNVVKEIQELENKFNQSGCPKKLGDYFIESTYIHEQNKQEYKEYLLTKQGFSLLAMGMTGQKAFEWKLIYIDEFNRMENELKTIEESKNKEYLNFITELYGEVYNLETALSILL